MRRRLERLEGEHVVDIGAHLARPPRPPRPHARADVIDDRQRRQPAADALGDGVREFGAVDDDDRVRAALHDGVDRAIDPPHDRGQARDDGAETHDGDVAEGKQAAQSLRRHGVAADPLERDRPIAQRGPEGGHELGAELIAGFLAGDQPDRQGPATGSAHAASDEASSPAAVPTRNIPSRSAVLTVSSRSRTRVTPLATATPRKPALAARTKVRGPIAGRSMRRSWPRFGILTRTPVPRRLLQAPGAPQSAHARKHAIGSFRPFDGDDALVRDHHALAHVVGGQIVQQLHADRDGAEIAAVRPVDPLDPPDARAVPARGHARRARDDLALPASSTTPRRSWSSPRPISFRDLAPVAQDREGAEHGGGFRAMDAARQGHGARAAIRAGKRSPA